MIFPPHSTEHGHEAASLIVGVELWSLSMTEEEKLTFRYETLRGREYEIKVIEQFTEREAM